MRFPRRTFLRLAAAAAALPALSRVAGAQTRRWPARTITLIVPFAPGGATDVSARLVAEHMTRTLGQQVVIQNLAGAGGTTGSTRAMRAEPDGYTILMGHVGTHAVAVSLYPNLAYKPDVDFEPIGLVSEFPMLIVARKDFPPKDLKEFVSLCEGEPRQAERGTRRRRLGVLHHQPAAGFDPEGETDHGAVQRRAAGDERAALRPGRLSVRRRDHRRAAARRRQDQGLCDRVAAAQSDPAERADHGRGRPARIPDLGVVRIVRAQGNAASRSSTGCRTRSTRRSTTTTPASACWRSPARSRRSRGAASRRCRRWSRTRSRAGRRSSRARASRRSRPTTVRNCAALGNGYSPGTGFAPATLCD